MNDADLQVPAGLRVIAVGLLLLAMMLGGCALQIAVVFSTWEWWTVAAFAAWSILGFTQLAAARALYEGEPVGAVGGALVAGFTGVALVAWCGLLLWGGLFTPLVGLTGAWEIVGGLLAAACIPSTRRIGRARMALGN